MATSSFHQPFAYRAQMPAGEPLAGTLEAPDIESARARLLGLGLRVLEIEPADAPVPHARPKPLRGDDFLAFNQQLAQLASAGLPLEQGLRLIAADLRNPRHAATLGQIAADLEAGQSLADAFEKHRKQFPPLYGRLIDAGVQTSNLPGMLLNLGRHMELVARLRTALWRAASYPFVILVGLLLVVLFLIGYLLPQFREMYRTFANFGVPPPRLTRFLLDISQGVSIAVIVLLIGLIAIPILWLLLGALGLGPRLMDRLVLPLPLVGPILRWNLVARWCDALDLAVHAGLDLPASVDLAADAVDSPRLRRDSDQLIQTLQSGQPLDSRQSYGLLPPLVPASMQAGSRTGDLPATLDTLSQMYQQQAELRLGTLPTVLAPLLMVVVALLIALVMAATLVPIISLIHGISGGW